MKRLTTGAGAAGTSEMKDKSTLLLIAAALITAALLMAFKAIDMSESEKLEPQSVKMTHYADSSGAVDTQPAEDPGLNTMPERAMPEFNEPETSGEISGGATRISANEQKININTATAQELTALTGIGEVKARAIVEYREENGRFRSIEELALVDGISYNTIEKNLGRITID